MPVRMSKMAYGGASNPRWRRNVVRHPTIRVELALADKDAGQESVMDFETDIRMCCSSPASRSNTVRAPQRPNAKSQAHRCGSEQGAALRCAFLHAVLEPKVMQRSSRAGQGSKLVPRRIAVGADYRAGGTTMCCRALFANWLGCAAWLLLSAHG